MRRLPIAGMLMLALLLAAGGCGGGGDSAADALAERLTDALDFDMGGIADSPPPEGSSGSDAPQVATLDAPATLTLGQHFVVVLTSDFGLPERVTRAIVSVGANPTRHIVVATGLVEREGRREMRLAGLLALDEQLRGHAFDIKIALQTAAGVTGLPETWRLEIADAEPLVVPGEPIRGVAIEGEEWIASGRPEGRPSATAPQITRIEFEGQAIVGAPVPITIFSANTPALEVPDGTSGHAVAAIIVSTPDNPGYKITSDFSVRPVTRQGTGVYIDIRLVVTDTRLRGFALLLLFALQNTVGETGLYYPLEIPVGNGMVDGDAVDQVDGVDTVDEIEEADGDLDPDPDLDGDTSDRPDADVIDGDTPGDGDTVTDGEIPADGDPVDGDADPSDQSDQTDQTESDLDLPGDGDAADDGESPGESPGDGDVPADGDTGDGDQSVDDRPWPPRTEPQACSRTGTPPIYISFLWHMHQPIYWPYEPVTETESAGRWGFSVVGVHTQRTGPYTGWPRDAVDAGRSLPHLGAQVSFSGSLIENLDALAAGGIAFANWRDPWREALGWTTAGGFRRLETVAFGYHHPLMPLIEPVEIGLQIDMHRLAAGGAFGWSESRGLFPPETAFSMRMVPALEAAGIEWVLVDNIHFDRARPDYPWRAEGGIGRPNRADQINAGPEPAWIQMNGLWAPTEVSVPWGYQPHWAVFRDPETGRDSRVIAVPAARYEGNEDGRGGFGALQYDAVLSQLAPYNTDPCHPVLVVLHHDGDNYGGGTDGYYHGNFQAFVAWAAANPGRFVPTTVEEYLAAFPPDPGDAIWIEDGSWAGADSGDPQFLKWNGAPDGTGYSPDRNSWGVIAAARNRVATAEAIDPHTSTAAIVSGAGSATDRAWHYFLNGQASDYWYWDRSEGGRWDSHPARAANLAVEQADAVIAGSGADPVGPTLHLPQREPYNPGADGATADMQVWTYAYDVSGIAAIELRYRIDADGVRTAGNEVYGPDDGWAALPMTCAAEPSQTDPMPRWKADRCTATVTGVRDRLVDYFVQAQDGRGNRSRTPLQHVWIGSGGGSGGCGLPEVEPSAPTHADPVTIRWDREGYVHWGVNGWQLPDEAYWPDGTFAWGDGKAVETPLVDTGDGCFATTLGPFGPEVTRLDFLFHAGSTWAGPDRVVPIGD